MIPTGRFAPSPTGQLHLGNLRTALLAWLFARSEHGRFLLRIEDLDAAARRPEIETEQLSDLQALGLNWDGPVARQSERRVLYDQALEELSAAGLLYPCYCTRREITMSVSAPHGPGGVPYPGTCRTLTTQELSQKQAIGRPPALRVITESSVSFHDRIHGQVTNVLDDFIVRRNDGAPAYNLAVVVDDDEQEVTQVVRGDDLLPTTHRQAWLAHKLGLASPEYIHVPLVYGPSKQRLAKRDGATSLKARLALGEDVTEVRSWLANSLGLAEPKEQPSLEQLLDRFDSMKPNLKPWTIDDADL